MCRDEIHYAVKRRRAQDRITSGKCQDKKSGRSDQDLQCENSLSTLFDRLSHAFFLWNSKKHSESHHTAAIKEKIKVFFDTNCQPERTKKD